MNILDLLAPTRVQAGVPVSSKKRVLEHAARLVERALAPPPDLPADPDTSPVTSLQVFDALLARERLGSTALGDGVAVPHCRLPGCRQPLGVLLSLAEGVDFDAPDNQPVHLVFALVVPQESTGEHLALLARIAGLLNDPDRRERLRQATDADELLSVVRTFEQDAPAG